MWEKPCGYEDQISEIEKKSKLVLASVEHISGDAFRKVTEYIKTVAKELKRLSKRFILCCERLDKKYIDYHSMIMKSVHRYSAEKVLDEHRQKIFDQFVKPLQVIVTDFLGILTRHAGGTTRRLIDDVNTIKAQRDTIYDLITRENIHSCPRERAMSFALERVLVDVEKSNIVDPIKNAGAAAASTSKKVFKKITSIGRKGKKSNADENEGDY